MKYRPEIDGLRAVAVIPVILFHAGASLFSGGFVGVDIFFVISGYLITTILITELEEGRFSILRFYERRARRILPALFFVLICTVPFAWAWMVPSQLENYGKGIMSVALFASNIFFWRQSGYFEPEVEENALLHTWSLAVEEQYYLIFPIFLMVCWRFGRGPVFWMIVFAGALSLAASEWAVRSFPNAVFYLTPFRAWELFAGSICAFLLQKRTEPLRHEGLAALGLVLITAAVFVYDKSYPFPSLWALAPVGGTVLIILFATDQTWVGRMLSYRTIVGVGLISYSAYLWHQPLFAFARIKAIFEPVTWVMALLTLASFGLAYISWRFVEQPFRRRPTPALNTRPVLFATSGVALLVAIAFGAILALKDGLPGRAVAMLQAPLIDVERERSRTWAALRNKKAETARRAAFLSEETHARVLIVGDSHSKDLFNALLFNADSYHDVTFLRTDITLGCKDTDLDNIFTPCPAVFLHDNADLFAAATHLVFSGRWEYHKDSGLDLIDTYLEQLSGRDKTLIVTSSTVEYTPQAPDLIRLVARDIGFAPDDDFPKQRADALFFESQTPQIAPFNSRLREIVAAHDGVVYADKGQLICDAQAATCEAVTPEGDAIYFDYGHWTVAGAAYLGRKMIAKNWLVPF